MPEVILLRISYFIKNIFPKNTVITDSQEKRYAREIKKNNSNGKILPKQVFPIPKSKKYAS